MRRKILWIGGLAVLVVIGVVMLQPRSLIKNGDLSRGFEGWETNAGVSIFHDPNPRDWRYYFDQARKGGLFHLGDVRNDRFAAIGAGNTKGSVLSQTVALDGKGGRYELSFLFAATGDAGLTALLEVSAADGHGRVVASETLTNIQPVKTYYVPRREQRVERFGFDVPTGTESVKVSFADKSANGGIAVDPLVKNVRLIKVK